MAGSGTGRSTGPLFFLSHGRVAPLPIKRLADDDSDPSVWTFYIDLCRKIGELLGRRAPRRIGFLDLEVAAEADWRSERLAALSAAQVLVPLYSPAYFRNSWSVEERNTYVTGYSRAVVPVLWVPFASGERAVESAQAVSVGGGDPAYERNGLRALCRLRMYRTEYLRALEKIAERIVAVQSSPAPTMATVDRPPSVAGYETATYLVGVMALTTGDRPTCDCSDCYGLHQRLWRPFGSAQALPITEYAEIVAQRLGLPTRIVEITGRGDEFRGPGVILIDPLVMESKTRRTLLSRTITDLPVWVSCLVINNPVDGLCSFRGEELGTQLAAMLARSGLPARQARALTQFQQIMPRLVGEARYRYLKHGIGQIPADDELPVRRGRLWSANEEARFEEGSR